MDRKIKFRGQRVDNGQWIYGYYSTSIERGDNGGTECHYNKTCIELHYINNILVFPDTVGQYIGLKDKNNKEIYEGDITRVYGGEYCQGYYEYDNRCLVKWQTCGFDMVIIREGYGIGLGFCDYSEYIEILGNKTDNPILLEK